MYGPQIEASEATSSELIHHLPPFPPLWQVAAISANRIEWAVCAYATFSLGAVWVPMYEQQRAKECEYILKDSGREGRRG